MDNLPGFIGNQPFAILGAERMALLLLRAIEVEKRLGTPMNAEEIEGSIREAAQTMREHYGSTMGTKD